MIDYSTLGPAGLAANYQYWSNLLAEHHKQIVAITDRLTIIKIMQERQDDR